MSCSISNRTRHDLGRDPDVILFASRGGAGLVTLKSGTRRVTLTLPKGREGVCFCRSARRGRRRPSPRPRRATWGSHFRFGVLAGFFFSAGCFAASDAGKLVGSAPDTSSGDFPSSFRSASGTTQRCVTCDPRTEARAVTGVGPARPPARPPRHAPSRA